MITAILITISVVTAVGYGLSIRENIIEPEDLIKPIAIGVIGIIISVIQPYSLERVDAGHVGIKVNLTGNDRGVSDYTYKTGWVVYNSWTENLYEFPTFQQHIEYPDQSVITKGGFQATIKPSFNYNIISTSVGDMFVNLRVDVKEVEQGWLKTAIIGSVNDVANKWSVDDIFNDREKFESAIVLECNKRVSKWFSVSQLRTNITPPEALQNAINNKTKAIQEAQGEIQKALVADAQAKVKIANAKGDSAKAVITASGRGRALVIDATSEAEAMRVKQKELNQTYIDYIKASNWDGKLPTTVLGNGSQPLINLK